jgi:hypothetical protein
MHRMEDEGLLRSRSVVVEDEPGASIQRLPSIGREGGV